MSGSTNCVEYSPLPCVPSDCDDPDDSTLVAIVLSTFEGTRYLSEQLRTFSTQTHPNWMLYWRDDGSSDESAAMVETFAAGPGWGRCIRSGELGRLRPIRSFLGLLKTAVAGSADYFAFSDQDDVWLPDKLANGVAALRLLPASRPALYFCARTITDERLGPLAKTSIPQRPPGFPDALTQNLVPGCCMIVNRRAAELISLSLAPDETWHDWWSYIIVAASGGVIIGGVTSDILYRQHGDNLVGETVALWRRGVAALRRGRKSFLRLFWRHVAALRASDTLLSEEALAHLAVIERARHGGLRARINALRLPGLVRQTWLETQVFRLWFLWP